MTHDVLFIVGMPRSGTKLLRDLLNRHDEVAIFPHETHFFPTLKSRLPRYGNINEWPNFSRLYDDLQQTIFFRRMTASGISIDAAKWFEGLQANDFRALLNALFSCYGSLTGARIVGDKTPSYITHVPLLADAIPHAKFVQIVRDPRDYAISMRAAWGKNMVRAAARWKDGVRKCRGDAAKLGVAYTEVRYEELLGHPREVISGLCDFLGIDFSEDMLKLARSSELLGDARGALSIVQDNLDKWRQQLTERELSAIESVAGKFMVELGYSPAIAHGDRNLTIVEGLHARTADAFNLLQFTMREEGGLVKGIKHLWNVFRHRAAD